MKKSIIFAVFATLLVSLFSVGCGDSSNPVDNTTPATKQGSYFVSYPVGATIWLDGVNTGKVTPGLLDTIAVGSHTITLKLTNFTDISISKTYAASTVDTVTNTFTGTNYLVFGPVRVWVSSDLSTSHPSGLSLLKGTSYALNASNANYVDFYLKDGNTAPDSTQAWSATFASSLTRTTHFFGTSETALTVGSNVQAYGTGSWVDKLGLTSSKSFIVYDNDNHYSKVIIAGTGIDASSNKQYIDFRWVYNKLNENYTF